MTQWTDHVKMVAKRDGIAYGKALSVASKEYKKGEKAEKAAKEPKATAKEPKAKAKEPKAAGTKKGEARKGEPKGSRLAFDDTEQEMKEMKKKAPKKK